MTYKTNKGFINITIPVLISLGVVLTGGVATFYSSLSSASNERSEIKTDVAVNDNRIKTLESQFKTIDEKLDELLLRE